MSGVFSGGSRHGESLSSACVEDQVREPESSCRSAGLTQGWSSEVVKGSEAKEDQAGADMVRPCARLRWECRGLASGCGCGWGCLHGLAHSNLCACVCVSSSGRYAVFGLGSSMYPQFCAFAHDVDQKLSHLGASQLTPTGEGDELSGQEEAFRSWAVQTFKVSSSLELLHSPHRVLWGIRARDTWAGHPRWRDPCLVL